MDKYPVRLPYRLMMRGIGGGFEQLSSGLVYGPTLIANPDFSAWGATPTGWAVTQTGGSSVTQVGSDGNAGTGSVRMQSPTTALQPRLEQNLTAHADKIGQVVEAVVNRTAGATGTADWYSVVSALGWQVSTTGVGEWCTADVFMQTTAFLFGINAPLDATLDSVNLRQITPVLQTISPNADLQYLFNFVSPRRGETAEIRFRQADGLQYHAARIVRNAAQTGYNVSLYRANTGPTSRTNLIAATALIGITPNGLRVVANGTSLTLYYTVDGGTNWVQVSTPQVSASYQTAETTFVYASANVQHVSFRGIPL
jgi:hypothetical protein